LEKKVAHDIVLRLFHETRICTREWQWRRIAKIVFQRMHSVEVYRSVMHVARDAATMRQTDRSGQKEAAMWTEAADYIAAT
jgi:hypothetical protein